MPTINVDLPEYLMESMDSRLTDESKSRIHRADFIRRALAAALGLKPPPGRERFRRAKIARPFDVRRLRSQHAAYADVPQYQVDMVGANIGEADNFTIGKALELNGYSLRQRTENLGIAVAGALLKLGFERYRDVDGMERWKRS